MIQNIVKHFMVITHHKWNVFKLTCKVGIPIRGIVHDLSKYTPTEFFNGVHYFAGGVQSPINIEKRENGYSKAWLHHKGRNKHHPEYWYDCNATDATPVIPFVYVCEMICDQLAAGIVYEGKKWEQGHQLRYWTQRREKTKMNEKIKKVLDEVYTEVAKEGIAPVLKKEHLSQIYEKYTKSIETPSQVN